MRSKFDVEKALSNLRLAVELLENGGTRAELSNILLDTMGDGLCDLHCITSNTFFLETILDMLPVPVYYKSLTGVYMGCNEALCSLYGKKKQEIIGRTAFDFFTREEAEMFTSSDLQLIDEKSSEIVEHRGNFTADGGMYNVIHKKLIMTPLGNVAGILGIIMDVTEHKESEERAWQGEAFYKSLYENSPRARIVYDSFNLIEDMNHSAVSTFRDGDALVGRDVFELFANIEEFERVMESGGKPVKIKLLGVEDEAVDALASLTVSNTSGMTRYAVSFILMDTIL